MSLYQRAADTLRALLAIGDDRVQALKTDGDALVQHLESAHKATSSAIQPGDGSTATVSGSPGNGFLVSIHDGTFFRSFVSDAEDAIAALKEGYERFDEAVAHEEPAAVPELEPAPVVRQPAGQTQVQILPVERPFDLDPGTLDVTRGRTGDEMPDEDKRMIAQQDHLANGTNVPVADPILPVTEPQPNEPVPPGVTEAAPVVGTHLGDDQAVSYEAQEVAPGVAKVYSSVEAALAAYASPATPGEHIAAAEQRAAEQQEASHGGTEESPKPV
jgi:hypothetical protein